MTILTEYLSPAFAKIIQDNKKFVIVQGVRRSGKTRYICFKSILESIKSTTNTYIGVTHHAMISLYKKEILELYNIIPRGLRPKITGIYGNIIEFENGSKIIIETVSNQSNIFCGLTIDFLLLDEFALVPNRIADEFLCNIMPCLAHSRGCGSVHIVSTRNTRSKKNAFWGIWLNAIDYKNSYQAYKIPSKKAPWLNTKPFKRTMTRSQYDKEFTIRTK